MQGISKNIEEEFSRDELEKHENISCTQGDMVDEVL